MYVYYYVAGACAIVRRVSAQLRSCSNTTFISNEHAQRARCSMKALVCVCAMCMQTAGMADGLVAWNWNRMGSVCAMCDVQRSALLVGICIYHSHRCTAPTAALLLLRTRHATTTLCRLVCAPCALHTFLSTLSSRVCA